jgi:hypothetical protein
VRLTLVAITCVVVSLCFNGITSCDATTTEIVNHRREIDAPGTMADSVFRMHDCKHRVTCWLTIGNGPYGISCLPDSQIANQDECK